MVLRAMIWIAAPLVIVCFFCRGYLARMIYTNGNIQIATVFGFLTAAIFFRIIYSLISRWYYAQKDTITPLIVSLFVIALNVCASHQVVAARRIWRSRPGLGAINSGRGRSGCFVHYHADP